MIIGVTLLQKDKIPNHVTIIQSMQDWKKVNIRYPPVYSFHARGIQVMVFIILVSLHALCYST